MRPLFSIVIPAYNRAELLKETIASVQEQTFGHWECIIVDDGSTDDTRHVVGQVSASDSRIRYVYQRNAERSAARNNGIRHAEADYICFLDSDDRYAPNYLERLKDFIQTHQNPVALIISRFCMWDGSSLIPAVVPEIGENVAEWLFEHPVSPSRACVHAGIARQFTFREDIVMVEDSVLWCTIATRFPILLMPECLVWYRVHEGNSVNRATTAAFKRHDGLLKFFDSPYSSALSKRAKRYLLSDVRFRMAEYYHHRGKGFRAVVTVMWSFLTAPGHMHSKAKLFFVLCMIPGFESLWNSLRMVRPAVRDPESGPLAY